MHATAVSFTPVLQSVVLIRVDEAGIKDHFLVGLLEESSTYSVLVDVHTLAQELVTVPLALVHIPVAHDDSASAVNSSFLEQANVEPAPFQIIIHVLELAPPVKTIILEKAIVGSSIYTGETSHPLSGVCAHEPFAMVDSVVVVSKSVQVHDRLAISFLSVSIRLVYLRTNPEERLLIHLNEVFVPDSVPSQRLYGMLQLSVFEIFPLSWELNDALFIASCLLQMLEQFACETIVPRRTIFLDLGCWPLWQHLEV